jgi:hypothetical protein
VAIAPDGYWLATADGDCTARIWAADGTRQAEDQQVPPKSCQDEE